MIHRRVFRVRLTHINRSRRDLEQSGISWQKLTSHRTEPEQLIGWSQRLRVFDIDSFKFSYLRNHPAYVGFVTSPKLSASLKEKGRMFHNIYHWHNISVQKGGIDTVVVVVVVVAVQQGQIAFGRQSNRPPRRITEKSLADSFPAEC